MLLLTRLSTTYAQGPWPDATCPCRCHSGTGASQTTAPATELMPTPSSVAMLSKAPTETSQRPRRMTMHAALRCRAAFQCLPGCGVWASSCCLCALGSPVFTSAALQGTPTTCTQAMQEGHLWLCRCVAKSCCLALPSVALLYTQQCWQSASVHFVPMLRLCQHVIRHHA